ncbi:NADH-quinone oxidoreductase subunit NuoH [Phototrophicus methaneseepsis]|uniref:NADH-quinone oxidoreductase subunit H n=1 Tax=Phototrophicus methaneseepsis TaxID=2710758 RepID=A0A7S8E7V3_9CHLR|nr:NADH-quinone oxidoreductase subunit NuoH [Phototrophicus methaneseepsis]QPC81908.1 NADH-quinone oxidoreductase subunit NuoH [Phototrophicus methaneseepsis]
MDCTGLCEVIAQSGLDVGLAQFLSLLLAVVAVSGVPLVTVIFLIWVERKIAARIQDRIGPNRVGPFGLVQTFADLLKLLVKEDITPTAADRLLYNVAPLISFASVALIWAIVPYTPYHFGADLEIGALYFVAVASLGTLAIMTAGWASNNKYALLGAFRVVALLVSYEIPLVFALMVPVLLAGSMSMLDIVYAQGGMWFVFMSPLAMLLFFISSQAETGRAPFDLIEAESELVAGFNIEYSGMKFGMFFAAEFLHVFTNGVLIAVLFMGGWFFPGWQEPLIAFFWLGVKASLVYFVSLWIRNTVPRFRIDQVMKFNWFFLVPISIVNVLVLSFLVMVLKEIGLVPLDEAGNMALQTGTFVEMLPMTIVLLLSNVLICIPIINRLRRSGNESRAELEARAASRAVAGATGD